MKIATVIVILVGIPVLGWLASVWINFWINRSIGEWMAMGVGIPMGIGVALIFLWRD